MLRGILAGAGIAGTCFGTGDAFLAALSGAGFDLLLIDGQVPDAPAERVLPEVRRTLGWTVPVILVTARIGDGDLAKALSLGADDFIAEPIWVGELLARIDAVLRRVRAGSAGPPPGRVQRHGNIAILPSQRRVEVDGRDVALTPKEFAVASYLLGSAGALCTRQEMLDRIWGAAAEVDTRTVDAHVSRLRQKLRLNETHGWRLASVYGAGYRLERLGAAE